MCMGGHFLQHRKLGDVVDELLCGTVLAHMEDLGFEPAVSKEYRCGVGVC